MRYATIQASADLKALRVLDSLPEQHGEPLVRAIIDSIEELAQDGRRPTPRAVLRRAKGKVGFAFPWVSVLVWLIPRLIRWWFSEARKQAEAACHED